MSEVNLLEGLENIEISEEQVNTLAFIISSKAIKEFEDWLAEVYFIELIFGKPA